MKDDLLLVQITGVGLGGKNKLQILIHSSAYNIHKLIMVVPIEEET